MRKPELKKVYLTEKQLGQLTERVEIISQKVFDIIVYEDDLKDAATYIYTDQDSHLHTIIKNNSYSEEEMDSILYGVYNQFCGIGSMCVYRKQQIEKFAKQFAYNEFNVTVLELLSLIMYFYPKLNDQFNLYNLMSLLTYYIDSVK